MSQLGPGASELVHVGREAGRATEEDRERNLAALLARLGAAPTRARIDAADTSRRASRLLWTMAAILGAVCAAGATFAITIRNVPI